MIEVMDRRNNNIYNERYPLDMLTITQMVPEDHLVRQLEAAIDFNVIYPLVASQVSKILNVYSFFFSNRSIFRNSLICAAVDAFRGHGFILFVASAPAGPLAHAIPAEVAAYAPIN
ncbi:hypothetical protein ACOMCU_16440 [Lysinibacillus sp. UGB7]|uniref:hypothetical protein n=1 Tax=Lysinibacillus sp. UGB7 TaxID=3411039 RepID=UPI003B81EEB7